MITVTTHNVPSGGPSWSDVAHSVAGAASGAAGAIGHAAGAAWGLVSDPAWNGIRAAANAQLTAMALSAAGHAGGSCSLAASLFWVCTGVRGIDALNKGGITLGNVYLLGEKFNPEKLGEASLRHEIKHADQWAIAALSAPGTPLVGQALMGSTLLGNQQLTGSCGNLFEILAGLGDGGYTC